MARKGMNIYKRKDGRWEGRYVKGRNPDGKNIYGYIYAQKFSEVKADLIPLKLQYAARSEIIKSDFHGVLRDWLSYWMQDIVRPGVKPATYASYQNKIQNHILPLLGDRQMDKLTQVEIQQFIKSVTERALAPSSVRAVFRILNAALEKAAETNVIFINPCKKVSLPKTEKSKINALTLPEQKALEGAALQDENGVAVILALYTGMRIGEICGLKWDDIDFTNGLLKVSRTMERIAAFDNTKSKTAVIFGAPKTQSSIRTIPLPEHLMAYLKNLREGSTGMYVVSCKGSWAEPRVVRYRFGLVLKSAGLPSVHFHSLRHTFATRCIERNIDVTTVSRLLGHSSAKMTLDTYTDSMLAQQRIAMSMMDALFTKEESAETVFEHKKENIIHALAILLEQERAPAVAI